MTTFGVSAPYADLPRKFGFTPRDIAAAARAVVAA
jgi:transketolase